MPVHRNPNAPHAIIIHVQAEIHERLPGGHYSGDPIKKEPRVLKIECNDATHAEMRLNDILTEMKQWQKT